MTQLAQQFRSLLDKRYRRAFRNLRHLPRREYRYVVDGGANIGSFTDAFLQLHQPERLVLVEAIPELAGRLQERYVNWPGVTVVAAALSNQDGEAPFAINRYIDASSLLSIDPRNSAWFGHDLRVERTIQVPTKTLSTLMEEQGLPVIDLLKLDLQGAERLVLTGGEGVLDRVWVIYTEVFFEQLYREAWLFRGLDDFLRQRRFKLCGLSNIVHAQDGDLIQANATFRRLE